MLRHYQTISTNTPPSKCRRLSRYSSGLLAVITALLIVLSGPRTARAQATVINVPCGQRISYSGESATIVLQPCTYPSLELYVAGSSVVVEGNGAIIDRGGGAGSNNLVGNAIFRDLTFTHGNFEIGGGLKAYTNNLVFERVTFTENHATLGGALYIVNGSDANITFIDSTISNNTARSGGGLYWKSSNGKGKVQLVRTTFSGNRAVMGAPDVDGRTGGHGGAIHIVLGEPMTNFVMQNSTISSNSADGYGGGLYLGGYAKVQISDSTLTANRAGYSGDAFYDAGIQFLDNDIRRTIIAGNGASSTLDCDGFYHDPYYDLGNNLLASECFQGSNSLIAPAGGPALAPLADNDGRTKTHLPLPGSPALNAIPAGVDGCGSDPATDQRGITRPQGSGCDIGAAEVAVSVDSTPTPSATATPSPTNTPTNTAVPPTATPSPTNTPTNTAVPPTATNTAVPPTATPIGTLIGTCGPITVYRNAQGKLVAPGWSGTIKVGTNGANTMTGTSGRDLLLGLGGNDVLDGQDGDDLLCSGEGSDLLRGGTGNDLLDAGMGNDVLNGGTGDQDTLSAGAGNDILLDGDGVATAQGGAGNDVITIGLRNGWRNRQGQPIFDGLTAGYGDDKVGLAALGTTRFYFDISGDERDSSPNPLDGQKDGLVLAGVIDPTSIVIKFEQQAVISAGIATSLVDQGFDLDPTTLSDESGSAFLSEPVGGDEPVEEAPAVAENLLFLPLVSR